MENLNMDCKSRYQNKFFFKKKSYLFLLFFIAALLFGCNKTEKKSVLSEHYDVIDSGFITKGQSINWMDNNQIIFGAIDPNNSSKGKLFIWNISDNKVNEYGDGGSPCYYDGYIYYAYKVDLKLTEEKPYGTNWKEGDLKKEQLFTKIYSKEDGKKWHKENVRNKFSCRLSVRPKEMKRRIWIPLLEEHGYLDFGIKGTGMNSDDEVFLHKNNKQVHKLNFLKKDVNSINGQYVEFKNQYFFWDLISSNKQREVWQNNGCTYGWWVNPETGDSYSECIPYAPWKSSHIVKPTIKGLFLINDNYIGENPRDSGGYLYVENKFKQVIKGRVRRAKVSPDGCKVAVAHQMGSHTNKKVNMTIKVINICKEKE